MTPLITPDYMKPQPKTKDDSLPSLAHCPTMQADVTVPMHYCDGEWFLCPACSQPHRVHIGKNGARSLSCL